MIFLLLVSQIVNAAPHPASDLKVAPGFQVDLWANVPGARSLHVDKEGTVFVGTGAFSNPLSRVYRIRDWNKDLKIQSDEIEILIDGLKNPNGVATRDGDLYVAETNRILVFKKAAAVPRGKKIKPEEGVALPIGLPNKSQHGWRYIRFAPAPNDEWLYVAVGAPCNVCKPGPEPTAVIDRIDVVNMKRETVAHGVRNSVGFDFHPKTSRLWFTDNGRDWLGDDQPDDELNELVTPGSHFGFPYCHAGSIPDPEYKFDNVVKSCAATEPPRAKLGPHVAALGMTFFQGRVFVALHGSWNRSKKIGYKVIAVDPVGGASETVVDGWLDEKRQEAAGRPVDVAVWSDGSLLISEDTPGAIYQLRKGAP